MQKTIEISNYSSVTYDSLLEFQEAKKNAATDSEKITELGDIICKYKLHEKIGLSLLHKHFDMSSDKVLLRNIKENVALTCPNGEFSNNFLPYSWKFESLYDSNGIRFTPLEFIQFESNSKTSNSVATIGKSITIQNEFLKEFSEKLFELELENAFGLSVLNSFFLSKQEHETFLETTDDINKVLTLKSASRELLSEKTIQTQWIFSPSKSEIGTACTHCSHGDCGHCFHS